VFADPDFDGEPIRIKPVSQDVDLTNVADEEEQDTSTIIDEITDEELFFEKPTVKYPEDNSTNLIDEPRPKVYVNGVDVSVLISREMYLDQHGKPITTNLNDHTKEIIQGQFASLNDFLNKWNSTDQKTAIIEELRQQGAMVEAYMIT
jgi:type I restriction enzyme, R subunit